MQHGTNKTYDIPKTLAFDTELCLEQPSPRSSDCRERRPNPSQNKQSSEREKKKIRKKLDQDRIVSNTEKDQIESVKI